MSWHYLSNPNQNYGTHDKVMIENRRLYFGHSHSQLSCAYSYGCGSCLGRFSDSQYIIGIGHGLKRKMKVIIVHVGYDL